MINRLSLRLRISLIFAALAAGSVAALVAGLYYGFHKQDHAGSPDALIIGGIVAGLAIVGLIVWVWILFDDHIAKPIERMAGNLRIRAHTHVATALDPVPARYLGDLAPAAHEIARALHDTRQSLAGFTVRETTDLIREKTLLETLLADIPVGVLMCSGSHQLAFYSARAASLICGLSADTTPGLGRSLFDYLHPVPIQAAYSQLQSMNDPDATRDFLCTTQLAGTALLTRMRLLPSPRKEAMSGYMLTLHEVGSPSQACVPSSIPQAPVYDFELLFKTHNADLPSTRVVDLTYVVFDTETTGLRPDQGDEIVQIAAVRIVNGRRIQEEEFNTLVNPGRAIPRSSSIVHGITDCMVASAPTMDQVGRKFHQFVKGAVLVAHNAPFDIAFLRRHERGIGHRFDNPVLDTVLLSALVYGQSENHSLDALCHRLGISITEEARHTAIGDATATAEVFLKLISALEARGLETYGDVRAAVRRQRRLLKDFNNSRYTDPERR